MINSHGEYMAVSMDDDPPEYMNYVDSYSLSGTVRRIYTTPRPQPIQAKREAKHLGAGVYEVEGMVTSDEALADAVAREYDRIDPHPIRYPAKFVGGPYGDRLLHATDVPHVGEQARMVEPPKVGVVNSDDLPTLAKTLIYRCEGWTPEHYVFTFKGER